MNRKSSFLIVLALIAALPAAAARQRAAMHTSDCIVSLSTRSISAPAAGLAGSFTVTRTGPCKWTPVPAADWFVVNTIEISSGIISYTIAPNADPTPRTTTVDVAGVILTVTQAGFVLPNLVVNGAFDRDTASWTNIFAAGTGSAVWSASDANNSASSGSARITSTQGNSGYQLHQCVNVTPNKTYEAGVKMFIPSGQDPAGRAIVGIYESPQKDCATTAYVSSRVTPLAPTLNTWTDYSTTITMTSSTQSVFFVIAAGYHHTAPFTVSFDDAYMREK